MNRINVKLASVGLALVLMMAAAGQSAFAQTYYWDNVAGAGFGTAGGTWAAPTAGPVPGWTTDGTGAATPASVTTANTAATTDALNFGNGATGLGGGTITVSGTVNSGNMTFASGSGAILISGGTSITLFSGATVTVDNASDTISTPIAGVNWTKAGTGILTLSGVNTFTGALTLSAGTLAANTSAQALGTGAATLVLNGGTLDLNHSAALSFSRNTTVGGNTTIISEKNSASAGVNYTLGTLSIGAFTLNVTPGNSTGTTAGVTFGTVTQTGAAVFDVAANSTLTLGALQTTAQAITKQNSGTLVLSAAANAARVAGANTLTAGTMRLGSVSALGTTGVTLVLNGGTLDLATDATVNAYNTTVGGAVTIASNKATAASAGITHTLGTLSIGAQTLTVTQGGNATGTTAGVTFGATTISGTSSAVTFSPAANTTLTLGTVTGTTPTITMAGAGTLVLSGTFSTATALTINSGGTVSLGTNNSTTQAALTVNGALNFSNGQIFGVLNGSGTITENSNWLYTNSATSGSFSGIIAGTGGYIKQGTGTETLSGLNTYDGSSLAGAIATQINGGSLSINTIKNVGGGSSALGAPTTAAAGIIALGATSTTGTLIYTGAAASTDRQIQIGTNATTPVVGDTGGGVIQNDGTGALTFSATNFNNQTNAATGTSPSRTLTIQGSNGGTISGIIRNNQIAGASTAAVTLTKSGAGTWALSGANTYTGNTLVTAGTLNISGTGSLTGNTTATKLLLQPTVAGTNAIVNYSSSGTSTFFAVNGANVAGTASVLNQSNGTIQISPNTTTDTQSVVTLAGAYGCYNISGGTFRDSNGTAGGSRFTVTNIGTASATNGTITGVRVGIVNVSGTGFIDHTNAEWWLNYSLGQITVTDSGKIDHTGSNQPFALVMNTTVVGGSYGVLNLAGSGAQVITGAQPVRFGNSATGGQGDGLSAFVNLAAGTLSTGSIATTLLPTAPTATNYFYYNYAGGTLKASANLASGWTPASGASVTVTNTIYGLIDNSALAGAPSFTGGLTVDTNGFNVTVPSTQVLLGASGFGVRQGNLSVSGGSGYIGAPSVTFSKPAAATGVAASGYALISGGVVTGIVITDPGVYAANEVPTIILLGGFATGAGTAATATSSALTTANTSGGLTKNSLGTLSLNAANTYTGLTTVNAGTLQAGNAAAFGTTAGGVSVATGAVVDLNGQTIGAEAFTLNGSGISSGGALINSSATAASLSGTINLNTDSSVGGNAGVLTLSGIISGGALTKVGSGITILSNANTYSGGTTVNAGTLSVTGSLQTGTPLSVSPTAAAGATLSFLNGVAIPLTVSTLNLGSVTGPSTLVFELGTNSAASDTISTSSAATTAGTINISVAALSGFGAGNYDLISAASGLDGATYVLTNVPGGFTYSLAVSGPLVRLVVTSKPGNLFWDGALSTSWNTYTSGANTNWYTDLAGTTNSQSTPGALNTVNFSTTGAATGVSFTTTLDNNFTVNNLVFNSFPLGITSVTIAPGTTISSVPGILTITPAASTDGINVGASAGSVTISSPVVLGAAQTWSVDGTAPSSLTVSGAITGTNPLTISSTSGTGVVTLSAAAAANTYSGATTVSNGGILQGGVAANLSAASAMTVNGTGILRLNGVANTIPSLSGNGIVENNHASTNATLTIGNASSTTFSGIFRNGAAATLAVTKVGAGTLTISGNNTHTGLTTVSAGTLAFGSATTLSSTNNVTLSGTGTLDLNGFSQTIGAFVSAATNFVTNTSAGTGASTATTTGTPSGAGVYVDALTISTAFSANITGLITDGPTRKTQLVVNNAINGTFITSNTANTYSGGLVLANNLSFTRMTIASAITGTPWGSGPIIVGQTNTDRAGLFFQTVDNTFSSPIVFNTALGNDRFGIRNDGRTITLSGLITANVDAVFSSNSTTASNTNITNKITGAGGLVIDLSQTSAVGTTPHTVTLNTAANTNDYAGDTSVGRVNGTPGQNWTATLTLGAANQIPNGVGKGNVIVNNNSGTRTGTLNLAGFSETINGLSGNGTVSSASGTPTLTLGDNDATASFSGVIQNAIAVTKIGTGTQTFSGASTFTGALSVNGGAVAFATSPATAGPLGNSTVVNLNGGAISYTGTGANAFNRPLAIGASAGTVDIVSSTGVLTIPSATSSGGNLIKTGPGTAIISGTTSLNGGAATVTVSNGTLQAGFGTGGISALSVGATGNMNLTNGFTEALTLTGALTLANGASLGFELGATTDSIAAGSAAVSAGTVTLNFFGTPVASVTAYSLITAPSGLDNATYVLGAAPNGFNYEIFTTPTLVSVKVTAYQPIYWRGGQDTNWTTVGAAPANWLTAYTPAEIDATSSPVSTDTVIFSAPNASGPSITTTLGGTFTIDSLQFSNLPTGVTDVTINAGGGTLTLSPVSTSGGIRVLAGGGNATIAAPLTLTKAQTWDVDTSGSLTISGNILFNNAVNKTNTGALTLSGGSSSGSAAFTLMGGTLNLNNATAIGLGVFTIGAGTTINASTGSTTLTTNNVQTWNGDYTFTGSNNLNLGTGAVTMANNVAITASGSELTVGGDIGDGGNNRSLTKLGAGTLTLSGANTFAGGTTLSAGTLNLASAGAVGTGVFTLAGGILDNTSGGALTLFGNNARVWSGNFTFTGTNDLNLGTGTVTLSATPSVTVSNNTLTVGGNITGTGFGFTKAGTGTLALPGAASTYSGLTTVSAGLVTISGGINSAGGMTVGNALNSQATVTLSGTGSYATSGGGLIVGSADNGTGFGMINVVSGTTLTAAPNGGVGGALNMGNATNAVGVINQSGGTVTCGSLVMGNATAGPNNSYSFYNLSGGTFTNTNSANTSRFRVGPTHASNVGLFYVSGGSANFNVISGSGGSNNLEINSSASVSTAGASSAGVLYVTGTGQVNGSASTNLSIGQNPNTTIASTSNGQVTIGGAGSTAAGITTLSTQTGSSTAGAGLSGFNAINILSGGTLTTGNITKQANGSTFINFNGGTLKVGTTGTTFGAQTGVYSYSGGATINTNGLNYTIAAPILTPVGSGLNAININSGGTGYIGAPAVVITGGTGTGASAIAQVSGGAVTSIVITNPGSGYTTSDVLTYTLRGGGFATAATTNATTAGDFVTNSSGGLTKTGLGTLTMTGANTYTGATQVSAGRLQLDGSAAGVLTTSSMTVATTATLGFTAGSATVLDLSAIGKSMTVGGTLAFDIGVITDSILVDSFTLTTGCALSFTRIGSEVISGTYTLVTSTNPIVTNGQTLSPFVVGKVLLTPTINTNTITISASLVEGKWNQLTGGDWSVGNPSGQTPQIGTPNWDNYKPTNIGDAALFDDTYITGAGTTTINVDSNHIVGSLRFNNAVNSFIIGSGSSSRLTFNNTPSNATVTVNAGSHTIAENVVLGSATVLAPATGTTLTISGALSGANTLTHSGLGTTTLSGVNPYSGATTVSAGTLNLTGSLTGGGAITVSGSAVLSEGATGVISGAASLTHSSSGTSTLGGANTYSGVTSVTGGTLNISGSLINAALGNISVSGGSTLNLSGTVNGNLTTVTGTALAYGGTAGKAVVNHTGTLSTYVTTGANIAGAVSVFNQTAGTVSIVCRNGNDDQYLANNGGYGMLNITGGTFNTGRFDGVGAAGNAASAAVIYVGGAGTLNQVSTADWFLPIRTNGMMEMTVATGGTFTRQTGVTAQFSIIGLNGTNTYGTLNVAGGTVDTGTNRGVAFSSAFSPGTGNVGIVNAAGGNLNLGANTIVGNATGSTNAFFNFAGATLKANAALTAVIPASTANYTFTSTVFGPITNNNNASSAFNTQVGTSSNFVGGLTVDTNNFAVSFTNALLGAHTKVGVTQADITIPSTGNSGYIGAPLVQFAAPAAGGDPASGYALLSGDQVSGIVITNPGMYTSGETPQITFTGGGGAISAFNTTALTTTNGNGGLTKIGAGTLTLTGTNTFAGTTTIMAGTLQIGDGTTDGSINSSANIVNKSALIYNIIGTSSYPGVISDVGTLTKTGAGTQTLTATNTYSGATTITAGTLQLGDGTTGNDGTIGNTSSVIDNGTLTFNRFGSNSASYAISGTGAVNKLGAGSQTLSGALTYTGATLVNNGTLQFDGSYAVAGTGTTSRLQIGNTTGTNGNVIVGAGAGTLNFGGDGFTNAVQVGISGGTGSLTINGGTVSFLGTTGTASASLNIGVQVATAAGTGTVTVNGGTLNVGQRILMGANNATSVGTLTVAGGEVNVGTNGTLGYTGNDPGSVQFGSGTTTVNLDGGTLKLFGFKSTSATNTINFNGGTVFALGSPTFFMGNNGANDTAPSAVGTFTTKVKSGGAIINTNTFNISIPTALIEDTGSTGGGLTKSGAGVLTLTGANTYTGPTVVSGGTLQLEGSAAGALTSSGLTVNTGGTLGFTAGTATALTLGTGSSMTLGGGTVAFDIGSAGVNDSITVGNLTINANSSFTFNNLGAVPGTYTLVTSTNTISNVGSFTISGPLPVGNLIFTPFIGTNTITLTVSLNEGIWNQNADGNWSDFTAGLPGQFPNWDNYRPAVAGDAALFGSVITAPRTVTVDTNLGNPFIVGFLRFDNANTYTIGSNGSGNLTLNNNASSAVVSVALGSHIIAEKITLATAAILSPATGTTLTMSGVISGANTLTLNGAGTTVLSGVNTYVGATTVSLGTLNLTGSLTGGAAVTVSGTGVISESSTGVISGASTFTHSSSGTSTLAGANTYTGATAISGGTLNLTGSLAGTAITVSGSAVLSEGSTGVISGTTGVTHNSTGTSTLAGPNTYSGATIVSNGTLTLSGARTGTSGAISVSNVAGQSATLNISNGIYALGGNAMNIGNAATTAATGTVNQTGGTISFTSGNQVLVGQNTVGNQGIYNMSGGSITTITSATRGIMLGVNSNLTSGPNIGGTFNLSGTGVINMTAASGGGGNAILQIGRSDTAANNNTNAFNQTGGTANVGILAMGGAAAGSTGVNCTLSLTGGTFSALSFTLLSAGGTNVSTINIGGTADVTLPPFPTNALGASSTATINFDGGTLNNSATSANYLGSISSAFIKAGGARFNTTNSSITITHNLLTDVVSTGGGLTKDGANDLTLSGTNTYTGVTNINAGKIIITSASALGTATGNTVIASGGEMVCNTTGLTIAEPFNIAGLGVASTGALHTGGNATVGFTGAITLSANAGFQGDGGTTNTLSGGIDTAGFSMTFNGSGATTVGTSGITGTGGSIVKNTGGVLTLSAANTFSGATTLNAGTLVLGDVNALQNTSGISMAAGTTLQSSITGVTIAAPITLSGGGNISFLGGVAAGSTTNLNGAIGGATGNVVYSTTTNSFGNQQSVFVLGAAGTYTGNTLITTGSGANNPVVLRNGVVNALPVTTVLSFAQIDGGGTGRLFQYDLNGNNQSLAGLDNTGVVPQVRVVRVTSATAAELTINNTANYTFGGSTISTTVGTIGTTTRAQITGAIALTKNGVGTFTLGGTLAGGATAGGNTFTGNTKVLGGILVLGESLSIQNSAFETANSITGDATNGLRAAVTSLTLGGLTGNKNFADVFTTTTGGYSGLTDLTLNPGTGVTNSYSADMGNGSGSMTLTKSGAGTQVLSGVQSYTGATTISGGTLMIADGSIATSSNIVNNAALEYNLNANARTYANVISGTGTLTKSGTNTLTLTNTNTYSGATNVNAGTLVVNGVIATASNTTITAGAQLRGSGTVGSIATAAGAGNPVVWPGAATTVPQLTSSTEILNVTGTTVDLSTNAGKLNIVLNSTGSNVQGTGKNQKLVIKNDNPVLTIDANSVLSIAADTASALKAASVGGSGEYVIVDIFMNDGTTPKAITFNAFALAKINSGPLNIAGAPGTNASIIYRNISTDVPNQDGGSVTANQIILKFESQNVSPVKIADFAAKSEDAGVNVSWKAVSEYQNAGFNIYRRSSDGGEWALVNPALIAGRITNPDEKSYSFFDWASAGEWQYKLESVDLDGVKETYALFAGPVSIEWNADLSVASDVDAGSVSSVNDGFVVMAGVRNAQVVSAAISEMKQDAVVMNKVTVRALTEANQDNNTTVVAARSVASAAPSASTVSAANVGVRWFSSGRVTASSFTAAKLVYSKPGLMIIPQSSMPTGYDLNNVSMQREGRNFSALAKVAAGLLVYAPGYADDYTDKDALFIRKTGAATNVGSAPAATGLFAGSAAVNVSSPATATNDYHDVYFDYSYAFRPFTFAPWFSSKYLTQGTTQDFVVSLPQASGGAATVTVNLWSLTSSSAVNPDHGLQLVINGNIVGDVSWDGGNKMMQLSFDVPSGVIKSGDNTVSVVTPTIAGQTSQIAFMHSITANYTRLLDGSKSFEIVNNTGKSQLYELNNVPSTGVWVVDARFTDRAALVGTESQTQADGTQRVRFMAASGGTGKFVVTPSGQENAPISVVARQVRAARLTGTYLATGPLQFSAGTQALLTKRSKEGIRGAYFDQEQLFDYYNFGRFGPDGIRKAVRSLKPTYLLLVGRTTYDYRNYEGKNIDPLCPAYLVSTSFWAQTTSDSAFGDLGRGYPEVAVGRLPINNTTELAGMVGHIIGYKGIPQSGLRLHAVADQADPIVADFGAQLDSMVKPYNPDVTWQENYLARTYQTATEVTDALKTAANGGADLILYNGHGNAARLGNGPTILDATMVQQWTGNTVFLQSTCTANWMAKNVDDYKSIAIQALTQPQGGISASIATSTYMNPDVATEFMNQLIKNTSGSSARWGSVLLKTQQWAGGQTKSPFYKDLMNTEQLFGDPAMPVNAPKSAQPISNNNSTSTGTPTGTF